MHKVHFAINNINRIIIQVSIIAIMFVTTCYSVYATELSQVTLTTTPLNTATLGTPVTLTATATGGVNIQYQFMIDTYVLRNFSNSSTYTFTPALVKTYNFTVIAKDLGGIVPTATVKSQIINLVNKPVLSAVSLKTTPLNVASLGIPVTLTATAIGGVNVQYQFLSDAYVLRNFSSSNTYTFTPALVKTYNFTVIAKDLGGIVPTAIVTSPIVNLVNKPVLSAVSLKTTPLNTTALGTPVTLTATATGGVNVQYQFLSDAYVLRNFSGSNTYTFTPALVKTYNFTVIAKDLGGINPIATVTSPIVNLVNKAALSSISLKITPTSSCILGQPVTLSAIATGGANVQYKFMEGATQLRGYQVGNTFTFTPALAKTYTFAVIACDLNSIDPTATKISNVSFTVKSPLTAVSLATLPLNSAALGTPVTLTATAIGGVNVQYQFLSDANVLRNFNSSNTYTFTPALVKTYNFTVIAKDLGGINPTTTVTSPLATLVNKPVLSAVTMITSPVNTATLGTPVTLTATSTGGANIQYEFMDGATQIRSFNTSKSYTFTPAVAKTYSFTVVVSDLNSVNPNLTYTSVPVTLVVTAP